MSQLAGSEPRAGAPALNEGAHRRGRQQESPAHRACCRWPPRYISHHRPPAISRKIGSARRAGGGGAERRSRNSVRVRSYSVGSGAPVAVWPRARTRVALPAVPTPHEYPGDRVSSPVHEPSVRVFRSRKGPGPLWARCPRAGRRALVVVRGAAAAGRALRASVRPVRRRRAAARTALRPRRGRCGRLRERALQHHRVFAEPATACGASLARPHRSVIALIDIECQPY